MRPSITRTSTKRAACGASAGLLLATPFCAVMEAQAGQYEALCGGSKCTIVVTPLEITSPFGSIPAKRVTYWGNSGETKTDVGTGIATTVIFGGIGLLGFLAKKHQYNYTVNGFDASGKAVSMQFEFRNDKPAKQIMQELAAVSGLGMGQTRTAEEIKISESGSQQGPGAMPQQASVIGPMQQSSSTLSTASTQPTSKNCWSAYLDSNPAMKKWAENNPAQAQQNKKRFEDC
jgi:hypothetical protein